MGLIAPPKCICWSSNLPVPQNVIAIDWTVSPIKSDVEVPASNMMVLGSRAFGRQWGLGEVRRMGPSWWDECPYMDTREHVCMCSCSLCHQWGSRKVAIFKPEREPSPLPDHLLSGGRLQPSALRKENCLCHSVDGNLLRLPEQSHTMTLCGKRTTADIT